MLIDDYRTIKYELMEDELPPAFEDQTLNETEAEFTGEELAMKQ